MPPAIRTVIAHGPGQGGLSRRRPALALAALCLALLGSLALAGRANAFVYWTNLDGSDIGRATDSGAGVQQSFIGGLDEPVGIAVSGGYIYWSEPSSEGPRGSIGRARLDGSDVDTHFITGLAQPFGIAVSGGHIYWAEKNANSFGYANVDGSDVHSGEWTGAASPFMIAISGGDLYYTTIFPEGNLMEVGRVDLETHAVEPVYTEETSSYDIRGVALSAGRLYWTGCTEGPGVIGTAAESGADPDYNFIPLEFAPNNDLLCPTEITAGNGHLYWAEGYEEGYIERSNLQGGDVEPEFITGAAEPAALAVTEPPNVSGEASAATTLGANVSDSSTLEGGFEPTGTLTYRLYSPTDATCSGSPVYTSEVGVAGNGTYHAASFTPTAAGTYHWTISYSGDAANEPAGEGCGASGQSVTVAAAPITIVSSGPAAAAQCTSHRHELIHWRIAPGVSVRRILISVNGRHLRTLPAGARAASVSFDGRHAGKVTVRVTAVDSSRARYSTKRVYHLCSPLHDERQVGNDTLG